MRDFGVVDNATGEPAAALTTEDVLMVLQPIWASKNETASRLRGCIEMMLDFAKPKGWRSADNPARWRGHLKNILPARKRSSARHLAAMLYSEVPAFVHRLRRTHMTARYDNPIGRTALRAAHAHCGWNPMTGLDDSPALHMAYTARHQIETARI